MKTGLTKRQKTTCIYFDEASKTVEIQTHNTALKKRLTQYAAEYPNLCRQTDDDEQGGLTFEIDRRRFAVRLTAPYSEEWVERTSISSYQPQPSAGVWMLLRATFFFAKNISRSEEIILRTSSFCAIV